MNLFFSVLAPSRHVKERLLEVIIADKSMLQQLYTFIRNHESIDDRFQHISALHKFKRVDFVFKKSLLNVKRLDLYIDEFDKFMEFLLK